MGTALASLLVALGALGVLIAAPNASAGTVRSVASGDPDYQRPVVGECHDYSFKGLAKPSDTSAPVSCDGRHTALVIAVVTPPAHVKLDPRPHQQTAAFRAVARQCYTAVNTTLGGQAALRAKTAYSLGYFVPTRSQLAQGARWVRCDLLLYGGRRLDPLPHPLLGGLTDAVRRCVLVSGKQVLTTTCNRAHGFRSTRTVTLHAKSYPSVKAFQASARRYCALPPGHGWFATWPVVEEWDYGHHRQLVCYRQTSS